MRRLTKLAILGSLVATAGLLAIAVAPWMDLEQELGLAWLYRARGPVPPPPGVVIVAIDEDSARALGVADKPRDWPRSLHAELVQALQTAGARVIVFDLTFDLPSPQAGDDARFADAARAAGNVVVSESVQKTVLPIDGPGSRPLATVVIDKSAPPTPVIEQAVAGHAPFLLPKAARVDAYWTSRAGSSDLPTLPVLALSVYGQRGAETPSSTGERNRIRDTLSALHAAGETSYFHFYGPPRSIAHVPFHQAIAQAREAASDGAAATRMAILFGGKAVFVGLSARTPAGQDRLRDDYGTVFSQADGLNLTGVELAATAFANLQQGRPLQPIDPAWQLVAALGWAALLAVICTLLPPARAAVAAGLLSALYLWLVYVRFADATAWWPSVIPVGIQVPLALVAGIVLHYRETNRERAAIKRAVGHFLPSAMVDQLALDLGSMTRSNRVVFGSCLSTDAGNFTTLAEGIEPDRLGQLMNAYFAELFVPVERHGGAVVDVVGDAMVAIWAASAPDAGLRRKACEAALDITAAVDRFNAAQPGTMSLPTRLGLHSGDMLVGNIGASHHYEYRAVGDIVNTASRLQGLNKVLGTRLLASASTVEGLDGLVWRRLGTFRLVGKASALPVVELRGRRAEADPARDRLCQRFEQALAAFDAGDWRDAAAQWTEILLVAPEDGPSRFYLARCQALLVHPPTDPWSPTVTVDAK